MEHIEMADGNFVDGCVRVDGVGTPHGIVHLVGGEVTPTSGNVTVVAPSGAVRRVTGRVSKATSTNVQTFDQSILGSHDGARRSFGPVAARFQNRADQNTANWSSKSVGATVTTGITAPDGTTGAATLTNTGNNYRSVALWTPTLAVGDWLIVGVWRRSLAAGDDDNNFPQLYVNGSVTLDATGTNYMVVRGPNAFDDGGWEWLCRAARVTAVPGGGTDVHLQLRHGANKTIAYYAPMALHIPVASIIDDDEMYDLARHLGVWSDSAAAGQVSMLRDQHLHIPKG